MWFEIVFGIVVQVLNLIVLWQDMITLEVAMIDLCITSNC